MQMSLNSNLISLWQLMGLAEQNTATCRPVRRPGPNPHLSDSLWAHPCVGKEKSRQPRFSPLWRVEIWEIKVQNSINLSFAYYRKLIKEFFQFSHLKEIAYFQRKAYMRACMYVCFNDAYMYIWNPPRLNIRDLEIKIYYSKGNI